MTSTEGSAHSRLSLSPIIAEERGWVGRKREREMAGLPSLAPGGCASVKQWTFSAVNHHLTPSCCFRTDLCSPEIFITHVLYTGRMKQINFPGIRSYEGSGGHSSRSVHITTGLQSIPHLQKDRTSASRYNGGVSSHRSTSTDNRPARAR